jgi:hypothetical protein
MSQRILIGIESQADSGKLKKELLSFGADSANGPSEAQSDLIVVTVPADKNLDEFLLRAKKLPGVRYAELDAWRFTT